MDDDDRVLDDLSDDDWRADDHDSLDSYDENEDSDLDTKRRDGCSGRWAPQRSDTPRSNSPEMRLLNRFRWPAVGRGALGGDGFIAALTRTFLAWTAIATRRSKLPNFATA